MKIYEDVYQNLLKSYNPVPPENGGIMGIKDGVICDYVHDCGIAISDRAVYVPDVDFLNSVIEKWAAEEINFAGIVHSHLPTQKRLSQADTEYIKSVFSAVPERIKELYFPVAIPGKNQLISYIAARADNGVIIRQDEIHRI